MFTVTIQYEDNLGRTKTKREKIDNYAAAYARYDSHNQPGGAVFYADIRENGQLIDSFGFPRRIK